MTLRLNPVARKSVPDALYEQLRDAIVTGSYQPGDSLPTERELADDSGANRLAVREALQRLRQVGLVDIVHGGGSTVTDWRTTADLSLLPEMVRVDHDAMRDELTGALGRFRLAIAIDACVRLARLWAGDAAPGDVTQHLRQLADQADGADAAQALAASEGFWDAVFDAQGSIAHQLINNTIRESRLALPSARTGRSSPAGHRAVVDAIVAGDGSAATVAVEHLLGDTL